MTTKARQPKQEPQANPSVKMLQNIYSTKVNLGGIVIGIGEEVEASKFDDKTVKRAIELGMIKEV
jgi:hypothetical protein